LANKALALDLAAASLAATAIAFNDLAPVAKA
jgi:hypothetical protein